MVDYCFYPLGISNNYLFFFNNKVSKIYLKKFSTPLDFYETLEFESNRK